MTQLVRGTWIVLEGPDGVGKSTQAGLVGARLGAVVTREPGGTDIGRRIREILLDFGTVGLDDRAEALLMAADRAQHIAEVVAPALASGRRVLSDRYFYSSIAYQAHGRGLEPDLVRDVSLWAAGGLVPDLVVLLQGPSRRSGAADRLEATDDGFRARVAASYRSQAEADPQRWAIVAANGSVTATTNAILATIHARLDLPAT